ncbi:hypothetical protein GLYMA_09G257150v4 [Glycine max]|nr:hypothetical protein GLYMA_09G257150v4 [Glycine max]KAH1044817.1 hypothetical protein GYH30_026185 [Glycine max]
MLIVASFCFLWSCKANFSKVLTAQNKNLNRTKMLLMQ